jgi:hypothetical protein
MMRCSRCSAWPVVRSPDSGTTAAFILQSQNGTLWERYAVRQTRLPPAQSRRSGAVLHPVARCWPV